MSRILFPATLLALLALPVGARAQRALTEEQWREDLRFLAQELPNRHRNAFDRVKGRATRAHFDSAVAALDHRIPSLADHEVVVGMAGLVAMIGDGHTRLTLPQDPADRVAPQVRRPGGHDRVSEERVGRAGRERLARGHGRILGSRNP